MHIHIQSGGEVRHFYIKNGNMWEVLLKYIRGKKILSLFTRYKFITSGRQYPDCLQDRQAWTYISTAFLVGGDEYLEKMR